MRDDYIPQPRPRLSDQAAAQVLDFLYDLLADFESAYLGQIQRHYRDRDAARDVDHTATPPPRTDRNDDPL